MTTQVETKDRILDQVKEKYGFIPNVLAEMAKSPAALKVYVDGNKALADASLSPKQQQVAQLMASVNNDCEYCKAAHSTGAKAAGVDAADIEAITSGNLPQDDHLHGVAKATHLIGEKQGWLDENDLSALEEKGVDKGQLYEVIAIVGLKTLSNYVNHIAHTEIDPEFRA